MQSPNRQDLLRYGLMLLVLVDLLGLGALLYNQVFGVGIPQAWLLSGVLTLAATPIMAYLVDLLLAAAAASRTVPSVGEKIPGAGQ
jgi:hypothetical protein